MKYINRVKNSNVFGKYLFADIDINEITAEQENYKSINCNRKI